MDSLAIPSPSKTVIHKIVKDAIKPRTGCKRVCVCVLLACYTPSLYTCVYVYVCTGGYNLTSLCPPKQQTLSMPIGWWKVTCGLLVSQSVFMQLLC